MKPDLPDIPQLKNGTCPRCGSKEPIGPTDIYYKNIHSPYSTGLPDYYVLTIDDGNRKWGSPYQDHWITARIPLSNLEEAMAKSRYQKI